MCRCLVYCKKSCNSAVASLPAASPVLSAQISAGMFPPSWEKLIAPRAVTVPTRSLGWDCKRGTLHCNSKLSAKGAIMLFKGKRKATVLRSARRCAGSIPCGKRRDFSRASFSHPDTCGDTPSCESWGRFRLPGCTGCKRETLHHAFPHVFDASRRLGRERKTHRAAK